MSEQRRAGIEAGWISPATKLMMRVCGGGRPSTAPARLQLPPDPAAHEISHAGIDCNVFKWTENLEAEHDQQVEKVCKSIANADKKRLARIEKIAKACKESSNLAKKDIRRELLSELTAKPSILMPSSVKSLNPTTSKLLAYNKQHYQIDNNKSTQGRDKYSNLPKMYDPKMRKKILGVTSPISKNHAKVDISGLHAVQESQPTSSSTLMTKSSFKSPGDMVGGGVSDHKSNSRGKSQERPQKAAKSPLKHLSLRTKHLKTLVSPIPTHSKFIIEELRVASEKATEEYADMPRVPESNDKVRSTLAQDARLITQAYEEARDTLTIRSPALPNKDQPSHTTASHQSNNPSSVYRAPSPSVVAAVVVAASNTVSARKKKVAADNTAVNLSKQITSGSAANYNRKSFINLNRGSIVPNGLIMEQKVSSTGHANHHNHHHHHYHHHHHGHHHHGHHHHGHQSAEAKQIQAAYIAQQKQQHELAISSFRASSNPVFSPNVSSAGELVGKRGSTFSNHSQLSNDTKQHTHKKILIQQQQQQQLLLS